MADEITAFHQKKVDSEGDLYDSRLSSEAVSYCDA